MIWIGLAIGVVGGAIAGWVACLRVLAILLQDGNEGRPGFRP